ncbi:sugar ABC transporter substrate-binding protein [Gracilibacillus oryzae]|uniref:Sugar ABC transporter substrate-binding protein n=1 Tax=Gracilibacillus oryzae TaxID=1672701 RepID=A0A7C8GQG3_9BACI|nr:sugar ABC transporter substrate-binding protein [Gracilibacillus oryzae]KAB8125924.1 sugar ABC transporter substrate-binding protein [Gracilibacillus oryzae]
MNKIICSIASIILISLIIGGFVLSVRPLMDEHDIASNEEIIDQQEKIRLNFWRNYGNSAENSAYERLINDFEKEHPNINIDMYNIEYSNYEVKLRTEIVTGTGPDIMAIDSPYLALYANAGTLLPLDSYITEDVGLESDFPEAIIEGLKYEDELYLMPLIESSIALYYNIHLFEAAGVALPDKNPANPITWEETVDIAKEIQKSEQDVYGIDPAQGFGGGEAPAYFKFPFLWQFGASVLDPTASTASGYLDSPEALEALQFYQDMYHKDGVAALELPGEAFEKNQLAMTVLGSWAISEFEKNGIHLGEDYGIAPLPKAKRQAVPNGSWALGISATTKYPEEAWQFIKYVTSYEAIKKYVNITGDVPARYSVAKDIPEFNEYPYNIFLEQAYNYSQNRPITPAYPDISSAMKELFEDIGIAGKDVRTSVDEAIEKINNRLADIE